MSLRQYIKKYHGNNKAQFARTQGVKRQQVTEWINKKYIVIDHHLYSPRRDLKRS